MMKQKKSFLDKLSGGTEEHTGNELCNEAYSCADNCMNCSTQFDDSNLSEWEREDAVDEDGQLAIDVYQTEDAIVIKSIIGGVRPEDLDISVTSDMVTIRGSREEAEESIGDNYYYQECFWGSFSRSVILPCDVKVDGVEASMKNGVLVVTLPKVEKNTSTKIKVIGK